MLCNNISKTYTDKQQPQITLTLTTDIDISDLKAICDDKKLLEVDIYKQAKKRSLTANSYAWVLITKVANVLRTNKEDLYIEMLKRYGQREPQLLSVIEDGVDMIYRATNNHCCIVGESELNGKTFKHLAILIGSSQYDTKCMAILIDGIVSECKELKIETLTPAELEALKSSWGKFDK
jgi:hypothetical protein